MSKHKLVGKNLVRHADDCGCDFLRTVKHAPWITYDLVDGILSCDRCKTGMVLPTPSVRENIWSKNVRMDHDAIVDDLNNFKNKHQDCQPGTQKFIMTDRFDTEKLIHTPAIVCLKSPKSYEN